jgi:hypothetical protein
MLALVALALGIGANPPPTAPPAKVPGFPPWYLDPASPVPPDPPGPNVPRTLEDLRATDAPEGSRCREGERQRLYVLRGERLVWEMEAADLTALPGHTTVAGVKVSEQPALPLDVLLARWPDVATVEVWPCQGEPLTLSAATVSAAAGRWLLVLTPRGFLKLVDSQGDIRQPLVRNVAALRLLP